MNSVIPIKPFNTSKMIKKYANLLCHYSLNLKKGEKLYIRSTTLAESLVREVYREALKIGVLVEVELNFREETNILLKEASTIQLKHQPTLYTKAVHDFDAMLFIRAPFNKSEEKSTDPSKRLMRSQHLSELSKIYVERTASGSLKRTLCEFPTSAGAQAAGMSTEEYETFIFEACHLHDQNPKASWKLIGKDQQKIVDYLNQCKQIQYKGPKTNVIFSVKNRTWINSDGKTNMPSGEVFTGPVEDSVNGYIHFDYPAIYRGEQVQGVSLSIKNGKIQKWSAEIGKGILDEVMKIKGARYFGEVAIGTNYNITKATKNILFDEKIGGTVHMALGQSYKQTGGRNESLIHWDMVSDMQHGEIYADGELIYNKGKFLIL